LFLHALIAVQVQPHDIITSAD